MSRPLPRELHRRQAESRLREQTRDPYRPAGKPPQPASCRRCGVVFRDGRWRRDALPAPAGGLCPACRRIADRHPAGEVRLSGGFVLAHRAEVVATLVRVAEREAAEHPLERIVEIRQDGDDIVVSTTGIHVARAMGRALQRAWDGVLDVEDDPAVLGVLVRWRR